MSVKLAEFNQKSFNGYIVERNIIGFYKEPMKLSSGRMSPYYIDWKFIMGDTYSMKNLVKYVTSFAKSKDLDPKSFIGVREGASPLGIATTMGWADMHNNHEKIKYPLVMGRGKTKEDHGDQKYRNFVGGDPRGDVVILEDVTTTGDSAIKEVNAVKNAGANVLALISLTDRCEKREDGRSVDQFFNDNGINYYPMSNSIDLIRKAYKNRQDGPIHKDGLESYFHEYGAKKLDLNNVPHMNADN